MQDIECAFTPNKTLLEVLREDVELTGTKHGCEMGHCGACSVLVDEQPVLSCLTLASRRKAERCARSRGWPKTTALHPVQLAFAECGGAQCGYCTPGFIMSAVALVEQEPRLSAERIRDAIAGNLCRCTGYTKIIEAIALASQRMDKAEPHA